VGLVLMFHYWHPFSRLGFTLVADRASRIIVELVQYFIYRH